MDPLHLCIAAGPLALYLLLLGVLNLGRRPRVVSGTFDRIALAFGVAGLVAVGPMELFVPSGAVQRYGPFVWFLLFGSYTLCVVLWLLMARPRLVIFNGTAEQIRPGLEAVAARLDADARWAGDTLVMPQIGVQLHLEYFPALRSVSLNAIGEKQSYTGWQRLHREVAAALASMETRPSTAGAMLLVIGLAGIAFPVWQAMLHRETVVQLFWQMLRM